MEKQPIPHTPYALIGGSSTFSLRFPEELELSDCEILDDHLVFDTPFGKSPVFKHFRLGEKEVLTVKMHGWRPPQVSRGQASQQLFWVFQQAGVKKIYAEGGVGAINHLLRTRDVVVPTDYIDRSMRVDISLGGPYLLVMRQPTCPHGRRRLVQAAERQPLGRVFDRSVYANTDGRHFESVAEIQALKIAGADVVGQSMCPEVYLAREIGACYARVDLVVNYAEGVVKEWEHEELEDIFYNEAKAMGQILIDALRETPLEEDCGCASLRKDTLLQEHASQK